MLWYVNYTLTNLTFFKKDSIKGPVKKPERKKTAAVAVWSLKSGKARFQGGSGQQVSNATE